jgi:hypothetical protein
MALVGSGDFSVTIQQNYNINAAFVGDGSLVVSVQAGGNFAIYVWDGATLIPASISVWNGTALVPAEVSEIT